MSYIDTFSGGTVQSSDTSYTSYNLTFGNLVLFWPSAFQDTLNVVYDFMNITSGGVIGRTITLPDARLASVGVSFKFINFGAQSINILNAAGGAIVTVVSGQTWELYLTDNTTLAGVWGFIAYGAGVSGVVSFTSVQPAAGFTVNQNATTGAIVQTFALSDDLLALENLAGTGYATRTAANTWAQRSFVQGANITIANPAGIAGNTTVAVNAALTNLTAITVGTINLSGNTIATTQANQNLIISPNGTGELQSTNSINIQSANQLKFYNAGNTFYTGIFGGNAAANTSYTMPVAYPVSNNQVLGSTTAGVMSWLNAVTSPGATTVNAIARYLNVTGQLANSGVLIDNANNITGAVSDIIQNIGIGTIAAIATSGTNTISAQNNGGGITLIPNGAGRVSILGGTTVLPIAGVPQSLIFTDGASANSVGFVAQTAAMAASTTYVLPAVVPAFTGQVLSASIPVANVSTTTWVNPAVIQTVRNSSVVSINTANTIPFDNTIPQSGEGLQAITATITPKSASSILYVEFYCGAATANAVSYIITTLFRDAGANALASSVVVSNTQTVGLSLIHYVAAGSTAATTFSINFGASDTNPGTITLLNPLGHSLGNTLSFGITITELAL